MIAFWKRWQSKLEPLLASEAAFGVFLLFIVYLAYGLFLPKMGFYWDDWETIYLARSNSLPVYWNYFIFDHPQAIWTQMILVPFLGLNPLKWQLFSLAMRWLNALLMYKVLRSFWPRQTFLLRWAAILVIVYPGFQQQPLSAIYSRYFLLETLFFLSLGCMVLAYRLPRWRILAGLLSIFLGVLQAVTLEYFSSLELLRPVLLYILVSQETMDRPKVLHKTLGAWLPYSLIPVAFLLYRYVFLPHILPEDPHPLVWIENITNSPVGGLIDFGLVILRNLVYVIFTTWTRQLQPLIF